MSIGGKLERSFFLQQIREEKSAQQQSIEIQGEEERKRGITIKGVLGFARKLREKIEQAQAELKRGNLFQRTEKRSVFRREGRGGRRFRIGFLITSS